jgi:hypothetical protein
MARSRLRSVLFMMIALLSLIGVRPVASEEEQFRVIEERTFEAWHVMRTTAGVAVATRNAADYVFAWTCDGDGCRWILSSRIQCDVGTKYPALASAGAGAYALVLECKGTAREAGYWRYQLTPDGSMNGIVTNAKHEMGIVMAKVGGQFEVLRFSMSGYGSALTAMGDMADRWIRDSGPSAPGKADKPDRQLL